MTEEALEMQSGRSQPDLPEVVLVQVRTGMWPGNAPLKHDDLGLDEERFPKELFKLGHKRLYPEEEKKKFTAGAKASAYLNKNGIPFLLRNTYVIPRLKLPEVYKYLKDEIGKGHDEAAESFLTRYDKIREDWLQENWRHRDKLEAHYPEKEDLKKFFKYRVIVFEIRGISAKEADEEILMETVTRAREDFENLCQDMVGEAIEVFREKVNKTVSNLSDRIRSGKIVRNDTLESVKNIHELFKELNIFGDTKIDQSLSKLRGLLDNVADAAFLKDNTRLQNEILELADAVSKQAEDLSDIQGLSGRYKRLIDMG